MRKFVDEILDYLFDNLFYEKSKTFYDYYIPGMKRQFEKYLPAPEIIKKDFPNPCGWGTGMEDGCINGGILLEALLSLYRKTGDKKYVPYIQDVFAGLKLCASVSDSEGFLARNVSPVDCKTHYINSSRDQYTHWISACCEYSQSELCSDEDRLFICKKICEFASRAERNVTLENDWSLLDEKGNRGVVIKMWGGVMPHEALRLPMIYISAWKIGGDEHFKEVYMKFIDQALDKSEKIDFSVTRAFAVNQMMLSLKIVYKYDEDADVKKRCLSLMKRLSDYGYNKAVELYKKNFSEDAIHLLYHSPKPWNEVPAVPELDFVEYRHAYYMPLHYKCGYADAPDAAWRIKDIGDALSLFVSYPSNEPDEQILDILNGISSKLDLDRLYSDAPLYLLETLCH